MGLLVTRLPATEHPDAARPRRRGRAPGPVRDPPAARPRSSAGVPPPAASTCSAPPRPSQRAVRLDVDRGATERRVPPAGRDRRPRRRRRAPGRRSARPCCCAATRTGVNAWALAHPSAVDVNPASWFADRPRALVRRRDRLRPALAGPDASPTRCPRPPASTRAARDRPADARPASASSRSRAAVEHAREVLAGDEGDDADALVADPALRARGHRELARPTSTRPPRRSSRGAPGEPLPRAAAR